MTSVGFDPPAQFGSSVRVSIVGVVFHVKPHPYDQRRSSPLAHGLASPSDAGLVSGSSTDPVADTVDIPRHA